MHFYQSGSHQEDSYRRFAEVQLPAAAVVIDVRQQGEHDVPLLDYLALEVEDLGKEMRLNQVPRWRHLAECMDFVKVDVLAPYKPMHEHVDLVLTARYGKQIAVQGLRDLAALLGRDYLDRVRNHRIRAIQDRDDESNDDEATLIDPEQPTVRVFLLADMESKDSIQRAITYAHWLKVWVEEQHGARRFNQDECIQTILLCLNVDNVDTAAKMRSLFPGTREDMALPIDICLLLQKYRDDAAYIGGDEQLLQVELLLYALLLHWPEIFAKNIEDAQKLEAIALINEGNDLPCPTYTLGIAAREYSARWAARWLDYAVIIKLLQVIGDAEAGGTTEQGEQQLIQSNIHKWLSNWCQELKEVLSAEAIEEVEDLRACRDMRYLLQDHSFVRSSPIASVASLKAWAERIKKLYTTTQEGSLQHAMTKSPGSIVSQFKWAYARNTRAKQGMKKDEAFASLALSLPTHEVCEQEDGEFYGKLTHLYEKIRHVVQLHFQEAKGALPKAAYQLAALQKEAIALQAREQDAVGVDTCREDFLHQADAAATQLEKHLTVWKIPGFGPVLRSTIVSLLIVMVVGIVFIFGISWSITQAGISIVPGSSSGNEYQFPSLQSIALIGIGFALLLLLICGEFLYLRKRKEALQQERREIQRQLQRAVEGHLSAIEEVIATRVALLFLESVDLYAPGKNMSPYEERMREMIGQVKRVREQAVQQQERVDRRVKPALDWQRSGKTEQSGWPDLSSRSDLLPWEQLEDAFLHSCQELESNAPSLNVLAEMLLRRLGTEKPANILQDIMQRQLRSAQSSKEEQFEALLIMLVTVMLALDIVHPDAGEVVPLLQHYTALKAQQLSLPSTINGDIARMQYALKEAALSRVLPGRMDMLLPVMQNTAVEEVLASWVGFQHKSNPVLEHILTSNDVAQCLVERQQMVPHALESLRSQAALLGYRDDMAADDSVYLLLAPGEASEALLAANDVKNVAFVHPVLFPDKEKLVYIHIHRVHQLAKARATSFAPLLPHK